MERSADLTPNIYQIHLPQFEGPFDLLLFFIERDELEIHDIPISTIANDFLDYIHSLESLNMEVASEFILVAATLMKIKAKMLLPRPVIKEDGTVEDPRTELVQRLMEYKRYKEAAQELEKYENLRIRQAPRLYAAKEEKQLLQIENPEEQVMGIDLYSLMKAYKRVLQKHVDRMESPKHVIKRYPYTVEELKTYFLEKLKQEKRMDFLSFVSEKPEKIYVIFGVLAILELTQQQKLSLTIGEGFNNFWFSLAA